MLALFFSGQECLTLLVLYQKQGYCSRIFSYCNLGTSDAAGMIHIYDPSLTRFLLSVGQHQRVFVQWCSQSVVGVDCLCASCFTNPCQHGAKEVHPHGLSGIPIIKRKKKIVPNMLYLHCNHACTVFTISNYNAHFP